MTTTRKHDAYTRRQLEADAKQAFACWLGDLDDGELRDMLSGNSAAYSGIPNLYPYSDCFYKQED